MQNWFDNRRYFVILLAIVILAIIMGMTIKDREDITLVEKVILDANILLQDILHKPVDLFVGVYNDIRSLASTRSENKLLHEQLDNLAYLEVDLHILAEENDRLRTLLGFKESIRDYDVIPANVVSRSQSYWDNIITIDRGEKHGIEKNMAVINHEGLVGRVFAVSSYGAKVLLITNSNAVYGVASQILDKDDSFGVIDKYNPEYSYLEMSMIKPDISIEKGDLVITSGLGGLYPKGIVIGTVDAAKKTGVGLTQSIYIVPAANIHNLNEVLVVKRQLNVDAELGKQSDDIEDSY